MMPIPFRITMPRRITIALSLAAVLSTAACAGPSEDPMNDVTQAEVEEERNVLLDAVKEAIPIGWGPSGDRGYYNCGGPSGISGLSHTQQTFGPPVEDREASARVAYAVIEERGYPVDLINRDNDPEAWEVSSRDGDWTFEVSFRTVGSTITDATRCFPWDDDVDGPPLEHTPTPTPTPTVTPTPPPPTP
jgi:hypothetical protein